jgi:hypothetical protein
VSEQRELREGAELYAVYLPSKEKERSVYRVGQHGVKSILVSEEHGQGAVVPWIRISMDDGEVYLVNAAWVECVKLKQKDKVV